MDSAPLSPGRKTRRVGIHDCEDQLRRPDRRRSCRARCRDCVRLSYGGLVSGQRPCEEPAKCRQVARALLSQILPRDQRPFQKRAPNGMCSRQRSAFGAQPNRRGLGSRVPGCGRIAPVRFGRAYFVAQPCWPRMAYANDAVATPSAGLFSALLLRSSPREKPEVSRPLRPTPAPFPRCRGLANGVRRRWRW